MNSPNASVVNVGTFEDELLRFLARQGRRVPIPIFLLATLIWGMVIQRLPIFLPSAWLCLVGGVLMLRWIILGKLPTLTTISAHNRLKIMVVLGLINGITHGLSLVFFWFLPDFERAVQSMLLFALCAGSVGTTAGYRPVFLAYIVPMLAPLSILWAVSAGTSSAWWIEGMTAVLIVFLALILFALSRDAFRLFKESFNIRLQQIHLNAKLSLALEHAEAASRAKTRFLASASHDLRQPMHTLSVFAAALAMRHLDARSHEIVTYMNEALEDLSSELDAILDISKLDAGVISIQKKAMALKPFLEHLRDTFLADARAKHLDLRIDCSDNFWVYTDKTALERVLRNLLQNAIKYTYSGHILLVVEVDGSSLLLTIADTGPGMSETEHMRIFEEFYQIDNPERDRQRGLGLGLAIVKRLLDLLEVEFRLISSPGFGTKFILKLPRVNTYDDIITESAISLSLSGLHILLVDDETKVRLGTKELLESSGCRVSDADGTAQAVMRALADPPDIVLADFRLRGTDDGITTVHTLRKIYPDLPALLVSGDTDPQRLREADAAGISLLHKPVSGKLLTKAIVMAVGGEMKNIA